MAAMTADGALRQLQVQALRAAGWATSSVLLALQLMEPARGEAVLHTARWGLLALTALMVVGSTEANAARIGVAVTVVSKVISILHGVFAETDPVVRTVLFGVQRILPVAAAIFGGIPFCIGMAVWSCLDITALLVWRRLEDGTLRLASLAHVRRWFVAEPELAVLFTEVGYVAIVSVLACAVAFYYGRALDTLASALNSRQRFISNMNHEIRTPLVGVLGMTDLLLDRAPKLDGATVSELQTIKSSGTALLTLINNILELSRLDAKMTRSAVKTISVDALLRAATDLFAATAKARDIRLVVTVQPTVSGPVRIDETRVLQVLGNLLGNALKFSPSGSSIVVHAGVVPAGASVEHASLLRGAAASDVPFALARATCRHVVSHGVRVETHSSRSSAQRSHGSLLRRLGSVVRRFGRGPPTDAATPSRLTFQVSARTPMLWFAVIDTGAGIAPASLEALFEPFQQGDNSSTRSFGGSGLGLAICREIVELLGGELVVWSELGAGSVFFFAVPCSGVDVEAAPTAAGPAADAAGTASSPAAGAREPRRRTTVLLVDDNQLNRDVISRQLGRLGCDTIAAVNGQHAVDLYARALRAGPSALAEPLAGPLAGPLTGPRKGRVPRASAEDRPAAGSSQDGASTPLPDLVLMDLDMPVMGGLEATRQIRALEQRAAVPRAAPVPIIALTASDRAVEAAACTAAGMQGFLTKPANLADLQRILETVYM